MLEAYLFSEYTGLMQQFVWNELADVYVELSKAGLRDPKRRPSTLRTLAYVLDRVLRLLHPIMPFITETLALQLWRGRRTSRGEVSLVIARWPQAGPRDVALEERFDLLRDVVRAIRDLRQEAHVGPGDRVSVALGGDPSALVGSLDAISALTNADVTIGAGDGPASVVRTVEVRVAAKRDLAAERARLDRELVDARESLRRSEELLARAGFAEKETGLPQPIDHL
ncbi:MAG: class I tRNA ligase family protein, partial [Chloroflexota bacterium]